MTKRCHEWEAGRRSRFLSVSERESVRRNVKGALLSAYDIFSAAGCVWIFGFIVWAVSGCRVV